MAILDISGRSLIGATRLRGYKGDSKPKGKPHSGKDDRGGLLDVWLKPLEASGYDFEAIERLTGISARHMRHVVAVKSRMELEAEKICPTSVKRAVGEQVKARAGTSSKLRQPKQIDRKKTWFVTDAEMEAVRKLYFVSGFTKKETSERLGIPFLRVQTICRAIRRKEVAS